MTEKLSVETRFSDIEYNLEAIRNNIASAARESGRNADDIRLMAVTKTVEPIFINHAIKCGIDLIGENKVQEFLSKKEYLNLENCEAHLIGHLQTNKVKQIVNQVSMIQSVDSIKLAKEISKHSVKNGIITECLIEINIGEEESKTGLAYDLIMPMLEELSIMDGIKIKGLMSIPPICEENKELFAYFDKMHKLFIDIKSQNIDNIDMSILSMGMSGDYREAILCGSNLVRVGSSIFGRIIY